MIPAAVAASAPPMIARRLVIAVLPPAGARRPVVLESASRLWPAGPNAFQNRLASEKAAACAGLWPHQRRKAAASDALAYHECR